MTGKGGRGAPREGKAHWLCVTNLAPMRENVAKASFFPSPTFGPSASLPFALVLKPSAKRAVGCKADAFRRLADAGIFRSYVVPCVASCPALVARLVAQLERGISAG